jgi:hypothetical protein
MRGDARHFAAASSAGLFSVSNSENTGSGGYYTISRSLSELQSRGNTPMFRLSAHTGLRITGDYAVDLTAVQGPYESRSFALARLVAFSGSPFLVGGNQTIDFTAESGVNTSLHQQGEFSTLWRNDRNHTGGIWGHIYAFSNAVSTSAVPEPSTWALMAAGLGFIVVAARRRHASIRLNAAP